jgi:hypothetical protein
VREERKRRKIEHGITQLTALAVEAMISFGY